jgi:phosphonate transport system substrate-binding protein
MSSRRGYARTLNRRAVIAGIGTSFFCPYVRAKPQAVSFGLTPVFLDSDIKLIGQIETYMTAQLGVPVTLVKRRTYMEITSLLVAGQLDAAWICGLPFVQHRSQLQLVAVPMYLGEPTYRSYIICHANDETSDPLQIRGRIHAFSDPDSNSGHLVTAAWLASLNETPNTFFSKSFFTYGHRNVIRAVASGLAESGSVDGYVWDVMREVEPDLISKSKVIRRSESMGFPPIASSRSTDPGVSKAIAGALINMPNDPLGQKILATLRLDGFRLEQPQLFDSIAAAWQRVRRDG